MSSFSGGGTYYPRMIWHIARTFQKKQKTGEINGQQAPNALSKPRGSIELGGNK